MDWNFDELITGRNDSSDLEVKGNIDLYGEYIAQLKDEDKKVRNIQFTVNKEYIALFKSDLLNRFYDKFPQIRKNTIFNYFNFCCSNVAFVYEQRYGSLVVPDQVALEFYKDHRTKGMKDPFYHKNIGKFGINRLNEKQYFLYHLLMHTYFVNDLSRDGQLSFSALREHKLKYSCSLYFYQFVKEIEINLDNFSLKEFNVLKYF